MTPEPIFTYLTERTRISPELRATPISNWSDSDHPRHILTRESVHPFTRPVLTDTLCISPEPLKRIHHDPRTHFHIPYRENKNLTGTARYTYIKLVRLGSPRHILTRESVHPFARPVLTDTLCISPEPLKRIHCILSKSMKLSDSDIMFSNCIATQESVRPCARPVLTDTVSISPEPLKRIHCIMTMKLSDSDILFFNYMATRETV